MPGSNNRADGEFSMASKYALSNPISLLVDKPRESFTRADLISVIETRNIERIALRYTALDGKLKELKVPVTNRYQAERVLSEGERVDGSSIFKGMVDASVSDLYVVPVYKTAFLNPFDDKSLDIICRYMTKDGDRAPFALDTILYNAVEFYKKSTGLDFYAMGELEFFLLSDPQTAIYPAEKQKGYHSSGPFIKSGSIVNEMVRFISQITGSVKYAHSEVGYIESVRSNLEELRGKRAEQIEIEFVPTPVEEAADNLVLAKWLMRSTGYKYGGVVTFTPKVEEGIAGNGLHIHMEARDKGRNIMTGADGAISDTARKIIGGLCKYADTLTAFGNTISSAYLRLVPNQEAPTMVCWSDLNRSSMIRVPLGWSKINNLAKAFNPQQKDDFKETGGKQTIELRSPDGSALVHLLLAGITLAAEWGISHPESLDIAEKSYVVGNIFKNKELLKTLTSLPKSCVESASLLLKKRELYEREGVFPASTIDYIAKLLNLEKDENMNQFLADLPADDRLHETRKIMHKDLHRH